MVDGKKGVSRSLTKGQGGGYYEGKGSVGRAG